MLQIIQMSAKVHVLPILQWLIIALSDVLVNVHQTLIITKREQFVFNIAQWVYLLIRLQESDNVKVVVPVDCMPSLNQGAVYRVVNLDTMEETHHGHANLAVYPEPMLIIILDFANIAAHSLL